jgi:hypothetical protein
MPAAAKFDVRLALDDISFSINEVDLPRDSNRTRTGIDEDLCFISHFLEGSQFSINRGSHEVLVSAMGGATSTLSSIQSDGYVRG